MTVGYERIRGLREKGQSRGGSYVSNKSKIFPVPCKELYRAFSTARGRKLWLGDAKLSVRKATPEKSVRMSWDDDSSVQAYFTAKGDSKSQVAIQHSGLKTKSDATRMRDYWGERLGMLAKSLR